MIDVWIKTVNRSSVDFVLKHLNFWLGVFSDTSKYRIILFNENVKLPSFYNCYKSINTPELLQNVDCKKLHDLIRKSQITNNWKNAAFALSVPYFHSKECDLVYNIDGDDIMIYGPAKYYFSKLEDAFKTEKISTASHDIHYSYHQGASFFNFRQNHWSFGVNLSKREFMKDLILKNIYRKIQPAPWGINIDYVVDKALEMNDDKYVAFITKDYLIHDWNGGYKSIRAINSKQLEAQLGASTQIRDIHERTLYIE